MNASFDASLKGLVLAMFGAVDAALGTDYRRQYEKSKHTIDALIGNLSQVFATHYLGVLFVDEIQCLMLRGNDEAKTCPEPLLENCQRVQGPDRFWRHLCCREALLDGSEERAPGLQWRVLRPRPGDILRQSCLGQAGRGICLEKNTNGCPSRLLSRLNMRKLIFRLTQSILAVFIALHRASQVYAIRRGMVTVDATVLREVYDKQFTLLHPALNALQSNKRTRLEKFEDLLPPKIR